ncbi:MAG: glycoside hydrolase family 57 protein [Candidatus Gastranaerophilales bacterium]|nr:glycoside hydrolase family 57 protein [Candidatus Gastranaerophilales bacterium]
MDSLSRNLSVAFYWHMHQPVYELDGVFLMPWVRLHAVKDYLDMVTILEKYPKLKLNFDIVPALLDEVVQYAEEGFDDIHSSLTVTPVEELSRSDKEYILNNFFNSKYETMIYPYPTYRKLFQKRFSSNSVTVDNFSDQEFSDLMALFNLSWVDPTHYYNYPELKRLVKKGRNYTLEDRQRIIELQKQIIREIIPTYKKYIQEGRIELTTSPYYHPIMPILCDYETTAKDLPSRDNLPVNFHLKKDAHEQVKKALDRIEEVFGVRPKGIWASEYCLTNKVLELFKEEGLKWTISDESILSKSINFEFVRDFKGNLEDPYYLLKTYAYNPSKTNIDIIFRDSHIPNLINFEYCNVDASISSNDLYNKIKSIQNKLLVSPDDNHLLTIALDGENCWENYPNDGNDFLEAIYSKIEQDDSIETVLISDYIAQDRNKKTLNKIHPGSWINKGFNFWIGDPVKNLAWQYVNTVREDVRKILKVKPKHKNKKKALRELYIAEGSDWFWWYGEPNNSGQDNVFDFLFREHLKNTYKFLDESYPEYLDDSIISSAYETTHPSIIEPQKHNPGWLFSDSIDLIDGPVFQESKIFDNINYGFNQDNLYFKLELNHNFREQDDKKPKIHQFFIYMRNSKKKQNASSIRVCNKTEAKFPILKTKYHNELAITLLDNKIYPSYLSKSMSDNLWAIIDSQGLSISYSNDIIDICIPFDDIGIEHGDDIEFFFLIANSGLRNTFMPKDTALTINRP